MSDRTTFRLLTVAAIISIGFIFTPLAMAKPSPPGGHLNIASVHVIFGSPDSIVITGTDFNFGGALEVTLAGFEPLVIESATATVITAYLPTNLPDGDYLLTVSTGNGQSQNDEYDLTIGVNVIKGLEERITALEAASESCTIDWEAEHSLDYWIGRIPEIGCTADYTYIAEYQVLMVFRCAPDDPACRGGCSEGGAFKSEHPSWTECLPVDEQISCSRTLITYMNEITGTTFRGQDPATCSPVQP